MLGDGSLSYSQGDRGLVYGLDGHERVYDVKNDELLVERGVDGVDIRLKPETGVDGRPLEFQKSRRSSLYRVLRPKKSHLLLLPVN